MFVLFYKLYFTENIYENNLSKLYTYTFSLIYTNLYSVTHQFSSYVYTLQKYSYMCTKRYVIIETL